MRHIDWHVGYIVRILREQNHWTQYQLAQKAGMNKATVVSVERMDRNHGRETYEKIAQALDLTIGQLYALVPPQKEDPKPQETQRATGTSDAAAGKHFRKR